MDKPSKELQEHRRYERLKANLQISYRVLGPDEAAMLSLQDYVTPEAFKANTVEMSDFKKLANEEVVVNENISLDGVKISVPQPVAEGTLLWLKINIPGAPVPVNAIGEVRWCQSTGSLWNAGLKFVGISKSDLNRVDGFLTQQKREQENVSEKNPSQGLMEMRSFERVRTSLDIKYRVVGPDEEAALKLRNYAELEAFSPDPSKPEDFNSTASEQVVVSDDISLGGLKISMSNPMTEGMRLWLQVTIPGVPIAVNAIGEVRWCRSVGTLWNAGVRFSGLSKPDLDRVDRFLLLQKRAQMSKRA